MGRGLTPPPLPTPSFSNLGIQCVKKKEIEAAIEKKLQLGIDPFKGGGLWGGGFGGGGSFLPHDGVLTPPQFWAPPTQPAR